MSRLSKAMIISLLFGILGVIASVAPMGLYLEENLGLKSLFRLRGVREPPSDVIIVSLDKVSSDNLNLPAEPEKWPRSFHASLTENLTRQGVAVIVFDMTFNKPDTLKNDNLFAQAIRNAGNVVLCECLKKVSAPLIDKNGKHTGELIIERAVPPIPVLAQSALALAPFPLPKVPVRVNQYWTFKTEAGDTPTLPVTVFQIFAFEMYDEFIRLLETVSPSKSEKLLHDKDEIIFNRWIEENILILRDIFRENPLIGEKMIEEIQNSNSLSFDSKKKRLITSLVKIFQGPKSRYLNYYGPPGTIETIPYYHLTHYPNKSNISLPHLDLKGKAVFVGLSEGLRPEQKDGFYSVFSQSNGIDISGVEIAASAFANLLEDKPVQPLVFPVHHATIFLWGVLICILCIFVPAWIAAFSVISLSVLYLSVALYQFNNAGIWYPLVIPLFFQVPIAYFGTVLWKFFHTHKERQNIRRAFEYYLPDKEVSRLAENLENIKTNTQTVYGTCLFTDAEQYTSLSEKMDPQELTGFMNKYYEAIFDPVSKYGGIVSDIKGDSMLSVWATEHPETALRSNACLAALDIISAVQKFKQNSDTFHLPTRMGMHSGYISLSNIGAINHYEYRPVGDIVNTASRIEHLNKHLGTRILVSQEVLQDIDGFLTRKLGEFILFGKSKPVIVYELMSRIEESSEQQRDLCTIFAQGLNAYHKQSWQEAIKAFDESIKIHKKDGPSTYYLQLCEKYNANANPPGEIWDGLIHLKNK
ncbi:MAG: adenylate/guanylate cyclase domain-containing protein [Deltaproteobacteria bacterium]|nr:adenylate/guanylate cyclase domain-containing protein [Deltaproteobacteria bacterium]